MNFLSPSEVPIITGDRNSFAASKIPAKVTASEILKCGRAHFSSSACRKISFKLCWFIFVFSYLNKPLVKIFDDKLLGFFLAHILHENFIPESFLMMIKILDHIAFLHQGHYGIYQIERNQNLNSGSVRKIIPYKIKAVPEPQLQLAETFS